jgi:hypothetical protein
MNWRELITGVYAGRSQQTDIATKPKFYAAASAREIADAEARLNARFPVSLRSLLIETNGVMDMMAIDGGEWFDSMWLLWTVAETIEQNDNCRAATEDETYERDFGKLVFFAGAGSDGILFGFPVTEDHVCAPSVVVWHPIDDEVEEIAPSLEEFLRGWLTSTISI